MPKNTEQVLPEFDPTVDRYPTLERVLSTLLDSADDLPRVVERVEISCLASGEATYRAWEPRAEESQGGYLGILS